MIRLHSARTDTASFYAEDAVRTKQFLSTELSSVHHRLVHEPVDNIQNLRDLYTSFSNTDVRVMEHNATKVNDEIVLYSVLEQETKDALSLASTNMDSKLEEYSTSFSSSIDTDRKSWVSTNGVLVSDLEETYTIKNERRKRVIEGIESKGDTEQWNVKGGGITGELHDNERFGTNVVLNHDGNTLLATSQTPPTIYIYRHDVETDSWKSLYSLKTPFRVIAMAKRSDAFVWGNSTFDDNRGRVKVLHWLDRKNAWVQKGGDIIGADDAECGHSVSIDGMGKTVAVSYHSRDSGDLIDAGQVKVLEYDEDISQWVPIAGVSGDTPYMYYGKRVELDTPGETLLIEHPHDPGNASSGCKVFRINREGKSLDMLGAPFTQMTNTDYDQVDGSRPVSMCTTSGNGKVVAITNTREVSVFSWNHITEEWEPKGGILPHPTQFLKLDGQGNTLSITTVDSTMIYSFFNTKWNLSTTLPSGRDSVSDLGEIGKTLALSDPFKRGKVEVIKRRYVKPIDLDLSPRVEGALSLKSDVMENDLKQLSIEENTVINTALASELQETYTSISNDTFSHVLLREDELPTDEHRVNLASQITISFDTVSTNKESVLEERRKMESVTVFRSTNATALTQLIRNDATTKDNTLQNQVLSDRVDTEAQVSSILELVNTDSYQGVLKTIDVDNALSTHTETFDAIERVDVAAPVMETPTVLCDLCIGPYWKVQTVGNILTFQFNPDRTNPDSQWEVLNPYVAHDGVNNDAILVHQGNPEYDIMLDMYNPSDRDQHTLAAHTAQYNTYTTTSTLLLAMQNDPQGYTLKKDGTELTVTGVHNTGSHDRLGYVSVESHTNDATLSGVYDVYKDGVVVPNEKMHYFAGTIVKC